MKCQQLHFLTRHMGAGGQSSFSLFPLIVCGQCTHQSWVD